MPILDVLHYFSVDRIVDLRERIEIFGQERRGQSHNRMVDNQPPLPADYPTFIIRPPLPTDEESAVMDVSEAGATPTTAEPVTSAATLHGVSVL